MICVLFLFKIKTMKETIINHFLKKTNDCFQPKKKLSNNLKNKVSKKARRSSFRKLARSNIIFSTFESRILICMLFVGELSTHVRPTSRLNFISPHAALWTLSFRDLISEKAYKTATGSNNIRESSICLPF